ncbi:sulfite exporter TauE/SafE family protein [Leifsonia sp. NCR5]|uniref:sulfite exporter TauE/SafE family protein n=1 Tax=Leifsonia sp. NCR5 TaxID=1978342 RepID=UPI00211A1FF0|nr:sulfite exporter TauE/SafE family protein [Leifsonia sp. NCR5]
MLVLAIPLGLLVGMSLGALGGGGSILTVPALVYLLGQNPAAASTSSLLIVGGTTLIGMLPHLRAGRVRLGQGIVFGLLGVVGTSVGSFLAAGIPGNVLLLAFAGLMLVVAGLMTRRRRAETRRTGGPATAPEAPLLGFSPFRCDCPRVVILLLTATGVGLLTGFFGVGGGFAVVPALVLALRLPMPVAVGTSLVVITVNSATALVSRLGHGVQLNWPLIATFAAAAIIGSLLGSRITARVSPARLNLWFTFLLIAVAIATAVSTILQLH